MNHYNYKKLEWDTNYFGCESSRIDVVEELTVSDIQDIRELIKLDEFITLTNPKGMVGNNKLITHELGAYLVDINVQLSNVKMGLSKTQKSEFIHIQNNYAVNEDIVELVKQAFISSRFYNDATISREKISGVYTHWVKNAFNKEEKYFCVFDQGNGVEGFILFSIAGQEFVTIELIAVNDKYRKNGIGTQLIRGLYHYCTKHGYSTVNVGTQVENINALNFYIKNELKIMDIRYIYHLWKKEQ
ncbi:GNAT family N-acetyltransferase [Turicibacter sanguinis]|uniref:GNAT family N-acetyltransferase n=1 Tax=Turicibacter sanguinis TaxID=154288 RepID=UPI0006BFFD13|nr:GNAT family N-acetyltransferase [Turicibacter sanguinis]MDB8576356.1 GNAT family N-acetyltransferase [Turicibacter sanguinis]MDB8579314.1 GNAT family N-acetyltransferase [Turicibacter sanguinis]MDB8585047.1 GNAT family N-acetyltransferase [Turicibacter sanguinis]MDB8588086.1 GNAT family N-acetyltransferase [Turicibacter sanguinis]MDB8598816.1 GNAT family N-acetyltransferase [Turicibacter sanguinis]